MLVGGGELHDRWSSLVGVSRAAVARASSASPASRRRWSTARRAPEAVLPALARAAARPRARRPQRALRRGACCGRRSPRAALDWPAPPVLCTVAMARRLAPLQRRRGLATLADALGIEVGTTHRALPDAELCAQVFCALFKRLCANAATVGERGRRCCARAPARRARARRAEGAARRVERRPDLRGADDRARRLRLPRRRRPSAVRRQVDRRAQRGRVRTSPSGAAWTARGRAGRLRGDGVRARRAAARAPADPRAEAAGQRARVREPDGQVYIRCRLDIAVPDPRGRARARRRPRGLHRPGARPRRRRRARRAAQLAVRPAPLRPQAAAPLPPVRLRADGPLPVALPRRPRPEPLPRAPGAGAAPLHRRARRRPRPARPRRRRRSRAASAARQLRARRVPAPPPRPARLAGLPARRRAARGALGRAARRRPAPGGAGPRRRPLDRRRPRRRLGAAPDCDDSRSPPRGSRAAAPRPGTSAGWLPPDEIDEVRLVGGYVASADVSVLELPCDSASYFIERAVGP